MLQQLDQLLIAIDEERDLFHRRHEERADAAPLLELAEGQLSGRWVLPRGTPRASAEESVARVLIVERLLGRGRASRLTHFALGPPHLGERRLEVEYVDPQRYANETPQSRRLEGTRRGG